ncbi:P-loop NTPase fold protein [Nannocystis bainbridge]|uniref:P-loop NTPase fold protein n=1 Tax=Nannocystis bainbridge TaxID=2995303 RepID=A0ABT5DWE9_9BACT|nr:P-loop NTPase fold protein [Nannocystis bainbridge]MDC0717885.1 P-loop NTPase fold protein [Nannocystis bainbridge]
MSENPNQHILSYLTHYACYTTPPRYALMITGEWGTGKTWLIQRHSSSDKLNKYLYISLYGAKSANDVAERIFAARHPFLASKGAVIAGRLIKGLVKISTTIDLNGDNKGDLQVSAGLPGVMDEVKKNPSTDKDILVFDDIERCAVAGDELWGLINQLVEHDGKKVILLSAENEIEGKDGSYRRTKEKTIGMTLKVTPDAAGALDCMLSEESDMCATVLKRHRGRALQLFEHSQCTSLRVLRFAIRDFCRIFTVIPSDLQDEQTLALRLLDSTLPLAFGVYSGALKPDEIEPRVANIVSGKQSGDSLDDTIYRRYSALSLSPQVLSLNWWRGFFARGEIEVAELASECKRVVEDAQPPDWLRLINFDKFSDSEFNDLLENTWKSLIDKNLHTAGQILHVAATHMWAQDEGVVCSVRSIASIIDAAKCAIASINRDAETCDACFVYPKSYAGVVYAAVEMAEFQELVKYATESSRSSERRIIQLESVKLLKALRQGGQAFAAALGVDLQDCWRREAAVPLGALQEVDTDDFVKILLSLTYHDQIQVVELLRIGGSGDWVKRMTARLEQQAPGPSLQKKMLIVRLKQLYG